MQLSARPMSLTRRLTLLFALVSSAVLLSLGLLIAASVERHFEDLDMVALVGKMDLVAQHVSALTSPEELAGMGQHLGHSLVGHQGLEVLVVGPDHRTLFASGAVAVDALFASKLLLSQPSPYPQQALQPQRWRVGDQEFRVVVAELPTRLPGRVVESERPGQGTTPPRDRLQPFTVRVAIASDLAHHQTYLDSLLRSLWIFVAIATALIGLLGWAAVRSGLKPLRAMREKTGRVTAQQLGHRLPVDSVPRELAELAESLNAMLARLQDAFTRLSDFSSDIAHELRTPVTSLMTQTQVALTRPRSAEDYRAVLESSAEELERMARMIADMLLLAKADNGLVLPHREPIDLAAEVRALFDFFEPLAQDKPVQLALDGSAQLQADRLMLRRALGNLLSNAIRHATPGSTVQVTLSQDERNATVQVSNQGDTLAPEVLERIFDRFYRADPARARSAEGAGLGLAITRSIVQAHGGQIHAQSNHGLTQLTIALPTTFLKATGTPVNPAKA